MFRERARTMEGVSLFLDTWCLAVAFGAAFALRVFHDRVPIVGNIPALPWTAETVVRSDYAVFVVVTNLAWIVTIRASGVYRSERSERVLPVALAYLRALAIAMLATGAATFVLKMGSVSRIFFGYYFGSALMLLVAKQISVIWLLRKMRRTGFNRRGALVIGAGRPAAWFARVLQGANQMGYSLVGLLLTVGPLISLLRGRSRPEYGPPEPPALPPPQPPPLPGEHAAGE